MCPPKEEAGSGIKGPVTRQMDGVRSGPGNVGVGPCWGRRALPPDALKGLRFGQEGRSATRSGSPGTGVWRGSTQPLRGGSNGWFWESPCLPPWLGGGHLDFTGCQFPLCRFFGGCQGHDGPWGVPLSRD